MLKLNQIYFGDCLKVMKKIDDKSIDMILCDLPYGTTACKWDSIISFELLWQQYKRIIKDNRAIVLMAINPFAAALIMSNPKMFRHEWIWNKKKPSNFLLSKKMPLYIHEMCLVFGEKRVLYKPQMVKGRIRDKSAKNKSKFKDDSGWGKVKYNQILNVNDRYYPKSILEISNAGQRGKRHPAQKPLKLFEYLIHTYSNQGDLILDNAAGSGTTGAACKNLNRNFILIEKEVEYCQIACERVGLDKYVTLLLKKRQNSNLKGK